MDRAKAVCPARRIRTWVTKALAVMFTSIFPVRIVFRVRRGESNNCIIKAPWAGFFSFNLRNCILDKEKSAVSEAEKRPDNTSKIINPEQISNNEGADFEEVIQNSVDVVKIANQLEKADQKIVLIYRSMGYAKWEISYLMGISERKVGYLLKQVKDFLHSL